MSETLYLVHHGIKGQKWGVRRFQEEDGSLTPAGERRYNQYKTLTLRDRAAARKAAKAFGRPNVSRQEIKDARTMSKRGLKKMKRLQSDFEKSGSTKAEAHELARNKVHHDRALTAAALSAAATFGRNAVVSTMKTGSPVSNLPKNILYTGGTFVSTYLGVRVGYAMSDTWYETVNRKKRHGIE